MHRTAYEAVGRAIADYVPKDRRLTVVDFGSGTTVKRVDEGLTHRRLLADHDVELIGVDIVDKPNVDVVMKQPYRVPMKSNSVDVVISGQVFEHIPFFWASAMEIARILKPGGIFIVSVPSRGHKHTDIDCYRYYEDGIRAMAAFARLNVQFAHTDHPQRREAPYGVRVYDLIDDAAVDGYWGDTVGVLEKPANFPSRRIALVREPLLMWANRVSRSFVTSDEVEAKRLEEQKRARSRRRARRRAREEGKVDSP